MHREQGRGSCGVGAGQDPPGVPGRSETAFGGGRALQNRYAAPARSFNTTNWEATVLVESRESPPPAHARAPGAEARGESGVRAGEGGLTLAPSPPGLCSRPLLFRDVLGAGGHLRSSSRGAGAASSVGSLSCPSVVPFPPVSVPHCHSRSLKPDHFPRYGAVSRAAEERERRWGGVSACVCVSMSVRRGGGGRG